MGEMVDLADVNYAGCHYTLWVENTTKALNGPLDPEASALTTRPQGLY